MIKYRKRITLIGQAGEFALDVLKNWIESKEWGESL